MSKRSKALTALSIAGVLAVGAAAMILLTSFKATAARTEDSAESRLVDTAELQPGVQTVRISGDGFLEAARTVRVISPVSGRVVETRGNLKSGIRVESGDVLLRIDDRRARLNFENARNEAVRLTSQFAAGAGLDTAGRDLWSSYAAALQTAEPGNLPRMPESPDRIALLAATMGVTGAARALEAAALTLGDHVVKAPFSGTVIGGGVAEGSMAAAGEILCELTENSRLELRIPVSADEVQLVSLDAPVRIIAGGGEQTIDGRVVRIDSILRTGSQTAGVYAAVETGDVDLWYPGLFVTGEIRGQVFENAYRVTRDRLYGNSLPVFRDGHLSLVPVTVLARDGRDVILAGDFPSGTLMVTTVLEAPIEGLPLRTEASHE